MTKPNQANNNQHIFFLYIFLLFFIFLSSFLPPVFLVPQWSCYGVTELLINCFPKCSLKVTTLLTSQTSPGAACIVCLSSPMDSEDSKKAVSCCLESTGKIQTPPLQTVPGSGLIKRGRTMRQQFYFLCALLLLLHMIFKEHYGILCT